MKKLDMVRGQFDDYTKKKSEEASAMMKKSIEEMERVVLTEDQEEVIKSIGEKTGIEIDGLDVSDMIDIFAKEFNPRDMAQPALNMFENADVEAAIQFSAIFDVDDEEYSEVRVIELLKETWEIIKLRFGHDINDEQSITKIAQKALVNNIFPELPTDMKNIMFEGKTMFSKDKYTKAISSLFTCIGILAAKEDMEAYVDRSATEIELIALQERELENLKSNLDRKAMTAEIIEELITSIKKDFPEIEKIDSNASLKFEFIRKIKSLEAMAQLCRSVESDNELLKARMAQKAIRFENHAAILKRVSSLAMFEPIKTYQNFLNEKNDKDIMKDMMNQIESYISRVSKYRVSIPFPGYRTGDKTFNDLRKSMYLHYTEVLGNYHRTVQSMMSENPSLNFPIFNAGVDKDGSMLEDFGANNFSTFILLALARYDKKFMKHVDLTKDRDEVFEYYSSYELLCKLDKDIYFTADIINICNELIKQ